jgi:uncharacterized membrane protein
VKKSFFLLSSLVLIYVFVSTMACKHEPTLTPAVIKKDTVVVPKDTIVIRKDTVIGWKCSPDTVYFLYDVQPVLVSACSQAGCHDAITKASGYQLTDYTSTMKKGVVPGLANSSKVYAEMANGSMPPRGSGVVLTQAQKDIVAKWINQGAKNLSCNPNFGVCDTVAVKFATFIQPIVQNQCQGCHSATNPSGGIALSNYAQIKASVQTGKFWGSIKQLTGYSKMPVGSKLSDCELSKIDAWIKRGALNN